MYSERSEELKARQEGENDPADMWYMPKKWKKKWYFLLYIDVALYEYIAILPLEW